MNQDRDQAAPTFPPTVRMTSIESFHLYSSNDEWPNCVTSRYHFDGAIDEPLARQAWAYCLQRQIFSMWPIVKIFGRPKWSTDIEESRLSEVAYKTFYFCPVGSWPENETDLTLPNTNARGIPEIGFQHFGFGLWCVSCASEKKTTLLFAADHALVDGAAAITFVREWMLAYHNLVSGRAVDKGLPKLDWERWRSRSTLGLLEWSFLKFLPAQLIGLFGASKFVLRKFSTIERSDASERTEEYGAPGICGRAIEPHIVDALNDRSERLNVSPNSLLMTIAFRAMKRLCRASASASAPDGSWVDRKWIRFILPISIRGIKDRKLPCTNKASIVQIERTLEQVAHADGAAQSIDREIRIIMGFKLDRVFLIAIRLLNLSSVLHRVVAGNQKSQGTMVFTNLGEPFRKTRACNFRDVGNLQLRDYDLCGPIRCGTPINFAWSTFRKPDGENVQMHGRISLHYDREVVSASFAELIVNSIAAELTDVVQFGGSVG